MRNYNEGSALAKVRGGVEVKGKTLTVRGSLGVKSWGAVDFLKNHCGYTVIIPVVK